MSHWSDLTELFLSSYNQYIHMIGVWTYVWLQHSHLNYTNYKPTYTINNSLSWPREVITKFSEKIILNFNLVKNKNLNDPSFYVPSCFPFLHSVFLKNLFQPNNSAPIYIFLNFSQPTLHFSRFCFSKIAVHRFHFWNANMSACIRYDINAVIHLFQIKLWLTLLGLRGQNDC